MMNTASTIAIDAQVEPPWVLPSRGTVGMICLIVAEAAIFIIFFVSYVFYMGKSYCRDQYSKWTVRRGHWMGFAINERIGRRQSCGWSSRVFSKRAAISQAMTRCQAMSRKHPELGYPNSCFLYDIK